MERKIIQFPKTNIKEYSEKVAKLDIADALIEEIIEAGYDFHILLSKEASKILFEPTEKIVSPTIMTSNIGEARRVIAELIETKPRNYYPLRGDEFQ